MHFRQCDASRGSYYALCTLQLCPLNHVSSNPYSIFGYNDRNQSNASQQTSSIDTRACLIHCTIHRQYYDSNTNTQLLRKSPRDNQKIRPPFILLLELTKPLQCLVISPHTLILASPLAPSSRPKRRLHTCQKSTNASRQTGMKRPSK